MVVSGVSYPVADAVAAYALSSVGDFGIGDNVTLLLGKDGGVAGVLPADTAGSEFYAYTTATGPRESTDANGNAYTAKYIEVVDTAGQSYSYNTDASIATGDMVKISFSGGGVVISGVSQKPLQRQVSASDRTIGGYKVSDDIRILDIYNGEYVSVYLSRIDGVLPSTATTCASTS